MTLIQQFNNIQGPGGSMS